MIYIKLVFLIKFGQSTLLIQITYILIISGGKSISKSFQTDLTFEFYEKYKLKLAYNYLDVFRMEHGHKHQFPFYSKHHALSTFSYQPADKDWHFDARLHWFGKKKFLIQQII